MNEAGMFVQVALKIKLFVAYVAMETGQPFTMN
jgi:hypothetical protein